MSGGVSRNSWMLAALLTLGCISFFSYAYLTDSASTAALAGTTAARTTVNATQFTPRAQTGTQPAAVIAPGEASLSPATAVNTVAKWMAEAFNADPRTRAAAITALATAPRSQAIAVLKKVLASGEPAVDRPLALRSLRALALQQGDDDGGIRDAFRQVIYDGSDAVITPGAQAALDEIESYLDFTASDATQR